MSKVLELINTGAVYIKKTNNNFLLGKIKSIIECLKIDIPLNEPNVDEPVILLTDDDCVMSSCSPSSEFQSLKASSSSGFQSLKASSNLNESEEMRLVQEALLASDAKELIQPQNQNQIRIRNQPQNGSHVTNSSGLEMIPEVNNRRHQIESNNFNGAKQPKIEIIESTASTQQPAKLMESNGSFNINEFISLEGPSDWMNSTEENSSIVEQEQQFQTGNMLSENPSFQAPINSFQIPNESFGRKDNNNVFQMPVQTHSNPIQVTSDKPSQMSATYAQTLNDNNTHISNDPSQRSNVNINKSNDKAQMSNVKAQKSKDISQIKDNSKRVQKTLTTTIYKCHLCQCTNDRYSKLMFHIANKHYKEDIMGAIKNCEELACNLCEYKPTNLQSLMGHLVVKHKALDTLIPPKEELVITYKSESSDYYNCHMCSFFTKSYTGILLHMGSKHFKDEMNRINPDSFNVKCGMCSHVATQPRNLRAHLLMVHKVLEKNVPVKADLRKPRGKIIKQVKPMEDKPSSTNKTVLGSISQFCCHKCSYSTSAYRSLVMHIALKHLQEEMKEINPDKANVQCSSCNHVASHPKLLLSHLLMVHKVADKFLPPKDQLGRKSTENIITTKADKTAAKKSKTIINVVPSSSNKSVNESKNSFHCHLCPFTTDHYRRVLMHIASKHLKKEMSEMELDKSFPNCKLCSYVAKKRDTLLQHQLMMHKVLDKFVPPREELLKPRIV